MIKIEGYKAFHGVMKITPKTKVVPPKEIEADWLYKPEQKCWYGNGASYSEEICTVVSDDAEKLMPKKPIRANRIIKKNGTFFLNDDNEYLKCPMCTQYDVPLLKNQEYCHCCGQALDWGDDA